MPYWLTSFNGVNLPTNLGDRGSMDVAAGVVDAPLVQLPGGRVFDPLGSTTAYRPSALFVARVMIVSNTPSTIKTVLDSWQALIGTVGTLTRTPDSGGTAHTLTARLMSATVLNRTLEGPRIARMVLTFQAVSFPWQSGGATFPLTKITASATNFFFTVTNAGNVNQRNIQISVTPAAGTTMTNFQILDAISPVLSWTGSVVATKILLINTSSRQVFNDGAAAYSGLTAPTTSEDWFALAAGAQTVTYQATYSGGTGVDVSLGFSDAWG